MSKDRVDIGGFHATVAISRAAFLALPEVAALIRERDDARIEAREKVATWMIGNSFATGHGDSLDDLLAELRAQIDVRRSSARDLYDALQQMRDEKADYMRVNNLGDPREQHTIKAADAALAKARGEETT